MAEKRKIMVEMTLEELVSFEIYLKEKKEKTNPLKRATIGELMFEISSRVDSKDKIRKIHQDTAANRSVAIEHASISVGTNTTFEYTITSWEGN